MSSRLPKAFLALAAAGVILSLAACGGQPRPSAGSLTASPALADSHLVDLTWLNSEQGWALAAAPCSSGLCPRVAVTRDGGRSWMALPVPPGLSSNWQLQISQIRFATAKIGYLFGPALYQTRDGGRSWRRVRSRPVEALEPAAGTIVRIVYDHGGCPGPCNRTVQESVAGSGAWHTLLRIPIAQAGDGVRAQIIRLGTKVTYVPVYGNLAGGQGGVQAVIFRSTDAGRSWQRLPDPCAFGSGANHYAAAAISAGPRGYLAVACDSLSGTGRIFIRTSEDYGSHWGPSQRAPSGMELLATPRPGCLVLATGDVGGSGKFTYRLDVSRDNGLRWTTVVTGTTQLGAPAAIPAVLGFGTAGFGWWAGTSQEIWLSRDDGRYWRQRLFPGSAGHVHRA